MPGSLLREAQGGAPPNLRRVRALRCEVTGGLEGGLLVGWGRQLAQTAEGPWLPLMWDSARLLLRRLLPSGAADSPRPNASTAHGAHSGSAEDCPYLQHAARSRHPPKAGGTHVLDPESPHQKERPAAGGLLGGCLFAGLGGRSVADYRTTGNQDSQRSSRRKKTSGAVRAAACPARQVLDRALAGGPQNGWIDGWLTLERGLCEPVVGTSWAALQHVQGADVWITFSERLPSLLRRGCLCNHLDDMPLLPADASVVSDEAVIAADVVLSLLAHGYAYEWRNNHSQGEAWDIEEYLPECIKVPWTTVCLRLGYPNAGLTFNALCNARYLLVDPSLWSSGRPYPDRMENLRFRPTPFASREEHVFYGCLIESTGVVLTGLPSLIDMQQGIIDDEPERVMAGLLRCVCMARHVARRDPGTPPCSRAAGSLTVASRPARDPRDPRDLRDPHSACESVRSATFLAPPSACRHAA